MRARYLEGARLVAPIAVAAFAFSLSFGVLARAAGMGWAAPMVMSATTFAGSAQFAVVSILGSAGSAAAAIAAAAMLNARYAPIGISIASSFTDPLPKRLLQSQLIVDESWALTVRRKGGFDVHVLLGAGALLYVFWNIGTALGLVLGNVIGDPNDFGLDAAFAALFLALLVPQLRGRRELTAALLGGGIALALIPFTPAGIPIVAGAAGAVVGWRRG
ncbi:MAG TPA: AzlC family ABC transporter permease [Gaiellaceae bacterium]|nr:AzlC family ABC transporter permease [Gaiellaceae bacterium]